MRISKTCERLTIIAVLVATFAVYPVLSALTANVVIVNSGKIEAGVNVVADSGSARDIQAAVDWVAAHGGKGNVTIPAGTFNFVNVGEAWQTVNVPPGINIIGAPTTGNDSRGIPTTWNTVLVEPYDTNNTWDSGVDTTFFNLGCGGPNFADFAGFSGTLPPNRYPIRFSNIKLQGIRTLIPTSTSLPVGIIIYGIIDYRIDHCCLENMAGGGIIVDPWYYENLFCCGVIDHCRIYNTHGWDVLANYAEGNIGYGCAFARSYYPDSGPWDTTMSVLGKYTSYTHFIENCYFSKWRHCVSSGHNGYYVFRYNIIDQDFAHYSLDVHGQRDTEAGRWGGRGAEIYENTFTNMLPVDEGGQAGLNRVFQDGGGCGVWFNNYVDSTYSIMSLYAEDAVADPTCHLKDFYLWGNKGTWTLPFNGIPSGFTASRNVYADWSRTAYDPTNPSYPNVNPSWSIAGYKPYPYPHPLTLG